MESYIKNELNLKMFKPTNEMGGGCISEGRVYETENGKVFVKWNDNENAHIMFNGEFKGLEALAATKTIRVPTPILQSSFRKINFLVMEYIKFERLDNFTTQMGTSLAKLHQHNTKKDKNYVGREVKVIDKFGFDIPTCCGSNPLQNDWCDDWVRFFTSQRLQPQISMITEKHGSRTLLDLWSSLQQQIPTFFTDIEIEPVLLHGDLWTGNIGETDTEPVIFDPATFYGHNEFEFGINNLFGGLSNGFWHSYRKESKMTYSPTNQKYLKRKLLYKLFHALNHWNHFGDSYEKVSLSIMREIVKECI